MIVEAFREHGMCCTFGIIPVVYKSATDDTSLEGPVTLSAEKADFLRNAVASGSIEPALHGYDHRSIRLTVPYTEFAGRGYAEQDARITEGKGLLEEMLETPVTCFVPPWNTYDANTVRVLERLNFRCLSGSRDGQAYQDSSLGYLPATCDLRGLRRAIQSAREIRHESPVIVVLFHAYDLVEADSRSGTLTLAQLRSQLKWVSAQPDLAPLSVGQLIDAGAPLGSDRLRANKNLREFSPLVPAFLPGVLGFPGGAYLSTEAASQTRMARLWVIVAATAFYIGVAGFFCILAWSVVTVASRVVPPMAAVCRYGGLILLAVGLAYGLRNLRLGFRDTLVISGLVGACLGAWLPRLVGCMRTRAARIHASAQP
jgi:predicted deacetylase